MKQLSKSNVITNSSSEVFITDYDPLHGIKDDDQLDESYSIRLTKDIILNYNQWRESLCSSYFQDFFEYYFLDNDSYMDEIQDQEDLDIWIELIGQDKILDLFEGKYYSYLSDHDEVVNDEDLWASCQRNCLFSTNRSGKIYKSPEKRK